MADTVTTLGLTILSQEYRGDVVRQINRRVSILRYLPIVKGDGKNLAFAPEADGQLAENYAEGADATNFGGDVQASAVLSWGLYRSNIHVTKLAMDASATASTPLGNRHLWARNLVNSTAKLASTINSEVFVGPGTGTRLAGLDVAIGLDANTYATIDRSVGGNSYFRPSVFNAAGPAVAPTFAQIRDDMRVIYEACGENPDTAFSKPAVFNTIAGLFDATRRQVDSVMTARGQVRLEFGAQALEVDGMMFLKDKDATAGQIYYLNTNHVEMQYLPDATMSGLPEGDVTGDDGFGAVPLGFHYEMLAKNGPSERAEVLSTIQMKVDRPNSCGVRKNVA